MNFIEKAIDLIRGGNKHQRYLKKVWPTVKAINAIEPELQPLSDAQLRDRMSVIRERVLQGVGHLDDDLGRRRQQVQDVLDRELVEVFALVREAGRRTLGMRHFDVQLVGGMVLHQGRIAEMRTGEGKTLVATLPATLNALTGRGVHLVTVNDYLARRDAEWMGAIYSFLGLTVGCIQNQMNDAERRIEYSRDITFGTNNEFGFDYLRDNMKFELDALVQRKHIFAVVDEVDSILVDEARTPLIISGPSEVSVDLYYKVNAIIPRLTRGEEIEDKHGNKEVTGDYLVDEKAQTASLTDQGVMRAERLLSTDNLYDPDNIDELHALNQALRAHTLFSRDDQYIVKDGEVVIVDEFTGRLMAGRRWSDGLHQAVEAKEGVKIKSENQTLATITLQNYFRMYEKLSGMTGTAETEEDEFDKIYGLEVTVIPTHKPMIRHDAPDVIFRSEKEKLRAVVEEITDCHRRGQPVLVGTVSVEKSELLSRYLKRAKVKHEVLNAKYHEREADIVAQAGRKGAVTIATNMAGRGTDIVLGGNPEGLAQIEVAKEPEAADAALEKYRRLCAEEKEAVLAEGGLHIIGTERHESRRIDNQLRGRSGRQGDPGSSRFFLALEDDLMRIFAGERLRRFMERISGDEDLPIESKMVTKAIERAQKQVEGRNFEARKHLLEYDDVMNKQREAVYRRRQEIIDWAQHRSTVLGFRIRLIKLLKGVLGALVESCQEPEGEGAGTDQAGINRAALESGLARCFGDELTLDQVEWQEADASQLETRLLEVVSVHLEERLRAEGAGDGTEEVAADSDDDPLGRTITGLVAHWLERYGHDLGDLQRQDLADITRRNLRSLDSGYIDCFGISISNLDLEHDTVTLAQLEQALVDEATVLMVYGRFVLIVVRNIIDFLVERAAAEGTDEQMLAEVGDLFRIEPSRLEIDCTQLDAEELKRGLRILAHQQLRSFLAEDSSADEVDRFMKSTFDLLKRAYYPADGDSGAVWNTQGFEASYQEVFGVDMTNIQIRWHPDRNEHIWELLFNTACESLDHRRRSHESGKDHVVEPVRDIVEMLVNDFCKDDRDPDSWDPAGLEKEYDKFFGIGFGDHHIDWLGTPKAEVERRLVNIARIHYLSRIEEFGVSEIAGWEKYLYLTILDRQWKDHLLALDHLREGIGLRAYGQRNPLVEYKRESFDMFEEMWDGIEDNVITRLFNLPPPKDPKKLRYRTTPTTLSHPQAAGLASLHRQQQQVANRPVGAPAKPTTYRRQQPKVGRNEPCPCGSGKKYKRCHGAQQASTGSGA